MITKAEKRKKAKGYVAGLFDMDERLSKLTRMGDPLVELKEMIDWEAFRGDIEKAREKERKSAAGAKPIDAVLMFKIRVLQQLNNLSDERIEYQIRDRLSFMRFLGLNLEDRVADAKTVWLFRETLKQRALGEVLFKRFDEQLAAKGLIAKGGQMIDATFVEVPKSRNSREDNATLKAGEIPESWKKDDAATAHMRRQKDTEARWTKKNQETHFGYKNHINADAANKLIRAYAVTAASAHDSQVKAASEVPMRTARIAQRNRKNTSRPKASKATSARKARAASRSPMSRRQPIGRSPRPARASSMCSARKRRWAGTWCAPSAWRAPV